MELGNAWHLPAPCPPSGQSVVPKSPAGTGAHRAEQLENPSFSIGMAASRWAQSTGEQHKTTGVFWEGEGPWWPTRWPGSRTPWHSWDGSLGAVDPLPSQAGSAVPLTAFAHTGIFLRSSN